MTYYHPVRHNLPLAALTQMVWPVTNTPQYGITCRWLHSLRWYDRPPTLHGTRITCRWLHLLQMVWPTLPPTHLPSTAQPDVGYTHSRWYPLTGMVWYGMYTPSPLIVAIHSSPVPYDPLWGVPCLCHLPTLYGKKLTVSKPYRCLCTAPHLWPLWYAVVWPNTLYTSYLLTYKDPDRPSWPEPPTNLPTATTTKAAMILSTQPQLIYLLTPFPYLGPWGAAVRSFQGRVLRVFLPLTGSPPPPLPPMTTLTTILPFLS